MKARSRGGARRSLARARQQARQANQHSTFASLHSAPAAKACIGLETTLVLPCILTLSLSGSHSHQRATLFPAPRKLLIFLGRLVLLHHTHGKKLNSRSPNPCLCASDPSSSRPFCPSTFGSRYPYSRSTSLSGSSARVAVIQEHPYQMCKVGT